MPASPQDYAAAMRAQQALKQGVSPGSTAGMLGSADAYNQYATDAMVNGQQPLPRQQWIQQMQQQPQAQMPPQPQPMMPPGQGGM